MNKNKKTMKGFTLIELIIVLAIFSVIMTLVMSFIDPVSRIMTKTSVRERTSAYVDNIGEYISKSIKPAQNIIVYEKGLNGATEQELVRDFVDTYYDGGIDENLDPLKGKVHVLKLINDTVSDGTDTLEAGRIYESVYDFTSGMGKPTIVYFDPVANTEVPQGSYTDQEMIDMGYTPLTKIIYDDATFNHSTVNRISDRQVVNDEHFKDYSYYYQLGMNTFEPITDLSAYSPALPESEKFFYSRITAMTDSSDNLFSDSVNEYQFVVNIVSFMNDDKDGDGILDNKIDCTYTKTLLDGSEETENVVVFKSPAAMSSVGMTFKNVQMQKESKAVKYYRKKLNSDGTVATEDGHTIIEAVTNNLGSAPFKRITDGTENNIYIIFTVPSEIQDTEWQNIDATMATTVPGYLPPI
ncbi:MAG: prepilin-type N-terminal cleavage/methylation domain-containing protein [Ruminococcus flavefaciens]|nr:prepilin-type N-terminal cleavage/methylation domain-containing protein [Ruminococcus flavefaciens]MCM1229382.1 prepilin-type N-terminal cleavage/methylation domain-containing protein [Ruminococcus flavefaciens]